MQKIFFTHEPKKVYQLGNNLFGNDENGNELCNGWMTGFYPAVAPRYAVTVMIENGGYGNQCAAPVFREIIDTMATSGY